MVCCIVVVASPGCQSSKAACVTSFFKFLSLRRVRDSLMENFRTTAEINLALFVFHFIIIRDPCSVASASTALHLVGLLLGRRRALGFAEHGVVSDAPLFGQPIGIDIRHVRHLLLLPHFYAASDAAIICLRRCIVQLGQRCSCSLFRLVFRAEELWNRRVLRGFMVAPKIENAGAILEIFHHTSGPAQCLSRVGPHRAKVGKWVHAGSHDFTFKQRANRFASRPKSGAGNALIAKLDRQVLPSRLRDQ